ncbi:MAG: GNAT family N-acetyltransferase [Candidatus Methanomethylophilaceae archaeon]|nr:GNAT family N-acetyltransferase [Candidatus Methanomethylophilaceae archaeon]
MINKLDSSRYQSILDYIGSCRIDVSPYIILNLSNYDAIKDYYSFYCQIIDGAYTAFISVYSNVVQLWANEKVDVSEMKAFILDKNIEAIYAIPELLNLMGLKINKKGKILCLNQLIEIDHLCDYKISKKPSEDDYKTIANLLVNDPESDSHSNETVTAQRYKTRNLEKKGRSYVLYDPNKEVIAHAGTHGESKKIAIIGGVITKGDHRGKGMATCLVRELCNDLIVEGKNVYLYSFNPVAIGLYKKIGFVDLYDWGYADLKK